MIKELQKIEPQLIKKPIETILNLKYWKTFNKHLKELETWSNSRNKALGRWKWNSLELSLKNVNTPHVQSVMRVRVEGDSAVAAHVAQLVDLETLLVGGALDLKQLPTFWMNLNCLVERKNDVFCICLHSQLTRCIKTIIKTNFSITNW